MMQKLKNFFLPHPDNNHTPHLLSRKGVLATLLLVGVIELSMFVLPAILPTLRSNLAAVMPSVVTLLTNEARVENRLGELTPNPFLEAAAQAKADDMASKSYFAHVSPDGSQPWDWIARAGYQYEYAGENLAVNFRDSEEVVEAWRNSPTHNDNLMGPRYTHIGVAVAEGRFEGRKAIFVVQMFGSPSSVPAPVVSTVPAQPSSTQPTEVAQTEVGETQEQVVLGADTELSEPSVGVQVAASPRTYSTYIYIVLGGLFLVVLVLGVLPRNKRRHQEEAVSRGVVALASIAIALILNYGVLFEPVELPVDSQNASVVQSVL